MKDYMSYTKRESHHNSMNQKLRYIMHTINMFIVLQLMSIPKKHIVRSLFLVYIDTPNTELLF